MDGSAGTCLPEADQIAGGVADRRHPQVSFRVRRLHHRATVRSDPLHRGVDAIDIDVGQQAGLPRDRPTGHPPADEVSGRIIKAKIVGVALLRAPAEDPLVEGGRPAGIERGYLQVRQATVPGQAGVHARAAAWRLLGVVLRHCRLLSSLQFWLEVIDTAASRTRDFPASKAATSRAGTRSAHDSVRSSSNSLASARSLWFCDQLT